MESGGGSCVDIISQYERKYFTNLNELFHIRLIANHLNLEKEDLIKREKELQKEQLDQLKEKDELVENVRLEMVELVRREEKFKIEYFKVQKNYEEQCDENEDLKEKLNHLQKEFDHAVDIIKYNEELIEENVKACSEIKNSFCWKITKPIRMIGHLLGRG